MHFVMVLFVLKAPGDGRLFMRFRCILAAMVKEVCLCSTYYTFDVIGVSKTQAKILGVQVRMPVENIRLVCD